MHGFLSHLSGRRPIEIDSQKTVEYPARKTCVGKRMGISDEPSRHNWGKRLVDRKARGEAEVPGWSLTERERLLLNPAIG